jgi:predicted metal-dependent phosphoesterase TrpH
MVINPTAPSLNLQNTKSNLETVFQNIEADSCPHSFNFHMHTVYSDGQLQPEALIQQAIAIGLQGLAITDHHSVSGYQLAHKWLENSHPGSDAGTKPILWSGVEISAGLLGTEVHILGYAFDLNHSSLQPYLQGHGHQAEGEAYQACQVITALHQAGGLAVLAHPARYQRPATDLIAAAAKLGIDGIETYYCYTNPKPWRPSPEQTKLVRKLGDTYDLLHTCGTDTHGLNLLQRL